MPPHRSILEEMDTGSLNEQYTRFDINHKPTNNT